MGKIDRRNFLAAAALLFASAWPEPTPAFWPFTAKKKGLPAGSADIRGQVFKGEGPKQLWKWSKEGFSYHKLSEQRVQCRICPNGCVLAPGDRSVCRSKVNVEGVLYSLAYGNPSSVHIDPIEKKPLFHFRPRTSVFSIATAGCNFRCLNCQNWEISQRTPEELRHEEIFPPEVVTRAKAAGATAVAYTYSESTTFFEYMLDTARLAKEANLSNLWISNGYINQPPLLELCKVIDAANVNLKSFDDDIYRRLNGGRLQPVLDTFLTLDGQGVHFEMTNLVVPGYVDDPEMVARMCGWILEHLGPDHPLHFLRFFPKYKLDRLSPTPLSTLVRFRELAMAAGIRYVYVGNVPDYEGSHTFCHNCRRLLVERQGYRIGEYNLDGDCCRFCRTVIPGVWL